MTADSPQRSSADHSVSPPRITFPRAYNAAADLVERNVAAGRSNKIAFIDDAGTCSYASLAERVNRCANAWRRLGLRIEDRVLLLMHDSIDFPVAFLGAIRAGVVPIPCNTLLTAADYGFLVSDSRARAVVVSAPLLPMIAPLLGSLTFLEHVIVSGTRIDGAINFTDWIAGEAAQSPVGAHDGRRRVLLALLVGLDRRSQGRRAPPVGSRQHRRALRAAVLGIREERRRVLRGQAVLRLRPRQRADLSARASAPPRCSWPSGPLRAAVFRH